MRQDAGVDGDAQRICQLCWMFFLKIIDDQDQELELIAGRLPLADPEEVSVAHLGGGPRGHHRRELLAFVNGELFPALKNLVRHRQARRPPPRRARRVRGRLQLHEVRPVDAAGRQQDQRASTSTTWPSASTSATSTSRSSTTCKRRQRGRVLHAARRHRLHGGPHRPAARRNPARSRLRHRRLPHLRDPPHARALCEDGRGRADDAGRRCARSRRSSCRTCSASPTCCCTASRTRASCATTTRWRGPTSATRQSDRVDIVLTNPPFGGREEDGIESNFPQHFRPARRPTCSSP